MPKQLVACLLLSVCSLACSPLTAPRRAIPVPTNPIALTLVKIPKILQKGETGTFIARTEALNLCSASIGYTDQSGKWTGVDLPDQMPNEEGICKWKWTAPLTSAEGIAEFRVAATREGEWRMLVPESFCIVRCP